METVSDELERLAGQAAAEDQPAAGAGEQPAQAGEYLAADVQRLREEKAKARAVQLMALLDWAIKRKDERLSVPESAYAEAGTRLGPVLLKHGVDEYGLPDWLMPYREEIAALVFVLGLGGALGLQLWQLRAADQAAAQEAAKQATAGREEPPQAGAGSFDWAKDDA